MTILNLAKKHMVWPLMPYRNLGQIYHNLHNCVFDNVICKPPIVHNEWGSFHCDVETPNSLRRKFENESRIKVSNLGPKYRFFKLVSASIIFSSLEMSFPLGFVRHGLQTLTTNYELVSYLQSRMYSIGLLAKRGPKYAELLYS